MKERRKTTYRVLITLAAGFLQLACCRHDPQPEGIRFNARALGFGDRTRATRTAYSGEEVTSGGTTIERIDWVNGDKLMVYCAQATNPDKDGAPYGEYRVVSHSGESGQIYSTATLAPSGGATGLIWGTGDHTFYGMYPSPGYPGSLYGVQSFTAGTMVFSLPAAQVVTRQGETAIYAPDMSLAPMLCKTGPVAARTLEVNLAFIPQYTAYSFTVTKGGNDEVRLKRFILTSRTGDLTGTVTVPKDQYGDPEAVTVENGGKEITIDWSGSPIILNAANPSVTYTVLALPQAVSGLKLSFLADVTVGSLTATDKTTSLSIKTEEGVEIGFVPYNKYCITGLDFPLIIDANLPDNIIWDYGISIMDNVIWWTAAELENLGWDSGPDWHALADASERVTWWEGTEVVDVIDYVDERLRNLYTDMDDTAWWLDAEINDGISDGVDYSEDDETGEGGVTDLPDDVGWWTDANVSDDITYEQFGGIVLSDAPVFLWRNQRYARPARCTVAGSDEPYFDVDITWSCEPATGVVLMHPTTGEIIALAPGTAVITATATPYAGGSPVTASYPVTVGALTGVSLNLSAATVTTGGEITLTATCTGPWLPTNLPEDALVWTSSHPCVTLSAEKTALDGSVTATGVSAGAATITVAVNPLYADGLSDAKTLTVTE